jgi:hypothetical protein
MSVNECNEKLCNVTVFQQRTRAGFRLLVSLVSKVGDLMARGINPFSPVMSIYVADKPEDQETKKHARQIEIERFKVDLLSINQSITHRFNVNISTHPLFNSATTSRTVLARTAERREAADGGAGGANRGAARRGAGTTRAARARRATAACAADARRGTAVVRHGAHRLASGALRRAQDRSRVAR